MKNELLISLALAVVMIGGIFLTMKRQTTVTPTRVETILPIEKISPSIATIQTAPSLVITKTTVKTVSLAEVNKHNNSSDCWIIINSVAYNVSSYLVDHPGGSETIIPYCGKEATSAFDAIKKGRGHPSQASMDLQSYYVADVK